MSETRWTEEHGRAVVRRWRRSEQSVAAFAREQGLESHRVHYWRERIEPKAGRRKQRGVGHRAGRAPNGGKLIPGVVVVGAHAPVRVHLSRGVIVEAQASAEIEPRWVAALARALEQQP